MDDATQGLTALLSWSTDFNGSAYNLAGSIAAALLGVALIFVVWALAMKKENAKSYLIAWLVCVIFTLLFIIQYGFFPSFSAAWRVSNENFFENAKKVIDDMKVRLSYGTVGNAEIGDYASMARYENKRLPFGKDMTTIVTFPFDGYFIKHGGGQGYGNRPFGD